MCLGCLCGVASVEFVWSCLGEYLCGLDAHRELQA